LGGRINKTKELTITWKVYSNEIINMTSPDGLYYTYNKEYKIDLHTSRDVNYNCTVLTLQYNETTSSVYIAENSCFQIANYACLRPATDIGKNITCFFIKLFLCFEFLFLVLAHVFVKVS